MRPLRKLAPILGATMTLALAACGAQGPRPDVGPTAGASSLATRDDPHPSRSLVRPSHSATATSRPTKAPRPTQAGTAPTRGAGWVGLIQRCIAHYESHGNLKAHSSAGPGYWGRYQFEDGLFHGATGLRGHASDYGAAVQDGAFLKVFAGGAGRHRWPHTYALCRAVYGGPA